MGPKPLIPLPPVPKPKPSAKAIPVPPPAPFRKSKAVIVVAYLYLVTKVFSLGGFIGFNTYFGGGIVTALIFSIPALGVIISQKPRLYKIAKGFLVFQVTISVIYFLITGFFFGFSYFDRYLYFITSTFFGGNQQPSSYNYQNQVPIQEYNNPNANYQTPKVPEVTQVPKDEESFFHVLPGNYSINTLGTIQEGLVGSWLLTDGGGGTAKDSSINKINGHIVNAHWSVAKDLKGSDEMFGFLDFNGWNTRVQIPAPSSLSFGNNSNITISATVHPRAFGPYNEIIAKDRTTGAPVANYALRIGAGAGKERRLEFYYSREGGGWEEYVSDKDIFIPDVWTYVAATYTFGQGDSMKLYVNGEQVPGRWISGSTGNTSPHPIGAPLWIGAIQDMEPSYGFNGIIGNVNIYNRILTGAEITRNSQSVLPGGTYN